MVAEGRGLSAPFSALAVFEPVSHCCIRSLASETADLDTCGL